MAGLYVNILLQGIDDDGFLVRSAGLWGFSNYSIFKLKGGLCRKAPRIGLYRCSDVPYIYEVYNNVSNMLDASSIATLSRVDPFLPGAY